MSKQPEKYFFIPKEPYYFTKNNIEYRLEVLVFEKSEDPKNHYILYNINSGRYEYLDSMKGFKLQISKIKK